MNNQWSGAMATVEPDLTPTTLTERHLNEWLRLLDYLQDNHAETNQLVYCRKQITRLQLDLYQLKNS